MKKTNLRLKRAAALLLTVLLAQMSYAADYLVYSVIGDVKQQKANEFVTLKARSTIQSGTRLSIGKESVVTVIDERNNKLHSLTTTGINSVQSLIAKSKSSKSLSKQYVSYMVKRLFSKESNTLSHPSTYMQTAAAAYRSTSTDSLLLNTLACLATGSTTVERAVTLTQTQVSGDYDVRFELISCATGEPITKEVPPNTSCYVRVSNGTKLPLYVNVLDIDENGGKYLVLPVDEAALCAHLLVPPESTVSFTSEPFEFMDAKSKEAFLLVATEEPVDFSILMSPIRGNGGKPLKSGLYRNIYETR